jgi:hypothetical protein
MKNTTMILAAAFLATGLAMPALASPPGHYSITFEYVTASYFDFKDGVGIADPNDQNNPCTRLLLGLQIPQPIAETWEVDQNMGTNLNGPGVGISNLVPPLAAVGGWLPASGGVDLGIPCPLPGSGPGNLWLVWSGMNWRSAQAGSSAGINLCTQQTFASSSPGCLAVPGPNLALLASACGDQVGEDISGDDGVPLTNLIDYTTVTFGHDYTDAKGKYLGGLPFDTLAMKNDQISCPVRHSHDYTDTVQDFAAGSAGQTFDIIKNEAVVHDGDGSTYMAVCWSIDYVDFTNPLAPVNLVAQTHDWKLILDLEMQEDEELFDFLDFDDLVDFAALFQLHYGGQQAGDGGVGGATVALRGFYSDDATGAGQNGFGPCPTSASLPEGKKPSPLV